MNKFLLLVLLICAGCQSSDRPTLHIYIWSNAIKSELLKEFEEREQCRIIIDTYDSNEALYAKLKLGATGYDLIFPSNYLIGLMAKGGLIEPFDPSKMPLLTNLDPLYPPFTAADKIYGIPYLISYAGLGYRNDKITHFDPTWQIFADKHYKGRMTMLNDMRESLGASLLALGYSVNSSNPDEVTRAADQLIRWKRNLAKFESEQYKNGIASAEYLIVHGFGGDILQVMQENQMVSFAYPKEGISYSIDYAALLKGAPESALAHAFINYLLEPEVAKENMLYTFYLHPCKPAYALLPSELQNNHALFPPPEVLEKAELIENLGLSLILYTQAWDRVKEE
jgi:spermidine/putrescine transport system substrate-binding protein